jgi:hypothetical protein
LKGDLNEGNRLYTPVELANEHEDSNSGIRRFVNKHPIINAGEEAGTDDPADVA